ncbi:hypothetical protein XENOCAPTIV_003983 [Xenoophorus captivus]|uniref:Uncharacterized protein n=1 Tax=Xenoophorus captivus TaxID=1517983 RepID=A0ABV0QUV3_9TELE
MSVSRDAVGVCLLGDRLYAVGGYDGQVYLSTVEAYDPQTNEWTQVLCTDLTCKNIPGDLALSWRQRGELFKSGMISFGSSQESVLHFNLYPIFSKSSKDSQEKMSGILTFLSISVTSAYFRKNLPIEVAPGGPAVPGQGRCLRGGRQALTTVTPLIKMTDYLHKTWLRDRTRCIR